MFCLLIFLKTKPMWYILNINIYVLYALHFFRFIYFAYINVLPECMYVHHMGAWCSQRSEEGIRMPGTVRFRVDVGIEPGSSATARSALKWWATSLTPMHILIFRYFSVNYLSLYFPKYIYIIIFDKKIIFPALFFSSVYHLLLNLE